MTQSIGRTWADLAHGGIVWLTIAIIAILGWYFDSFGWVAEIPLWIMVSIGSSLIFMPFLVARAKDDARLVVVVDGSLKMTEYRIGKRYKWNIDGEPITFHSNTGTHRLLVTAFNPETGAAKGTALSGYTQFDLVRDVCVFTRLTEAFSEHIREERLTKESIGIEVERRVSKLSSRWLGILYGSLDPTEIEDALSIESEAIPAPTEMDIGDVIDD